MAQIRGICKVRGFGEDPWITHALLPVMNALADRARIVAPSEAKWSADLDATERCVPR